MFVQHLFLNKPELEDITSWHSTMPGRPSPIMNLWRCLSKYSFSFLDQATHLRLVCFSEKGVVSHNSSIATEATEATEVSLSR